MLGRRLDPKLLDKPQPFSGSASRWRIWKLRTYGWLSAVDPRFHKLLPEAERSELSLATVDDQISDLDEFLYAQLLVWLETEQLEVLLRGPDGHGFEGWRVLVRAQERLEPTRKVMQIEKLLHPQFGERGTWRRAWLNWEAEVQRHAVLLGGVLTDDVKIGLVRTRTPSDLKQHLMLTAKDYGGDYDVFRLKIEEYWKAMMEPTEEAEEAELDFVDRGPSSWQGGKYGKGGRGDGRKGGDGGKGSHGGEAGGRQGLRGPQCYHCGQKGHVAKQCPEKDKAARCYYCGRPGHTTKECRTKQRDLDAGQGGGGKGAWQQRGGGGGKKGGGKFDRGRAAQSHQVEAEVEAHLVERPPEQTWIMMAMQTTDDKKDVLSVTTRPETWVIDSGSMTHVMRADVATQFLGELQPQRGVDLRGAGGHRLQYYGTAEIVLYMNGQKFKMNVEIADIKHNLLSVPKLQDHNYNVEFTRGSGRLSRGTWSTDIERRSNLYQVEGHITEVHMLAPHFGANVVMPIDIDLEKSDHATGSGHQSYDVPQGDDAPRASAVAAVAPLQDEPVDPPNEEEPRQVREVVESHMPDAATRRMHVLAGHLGHAPWCTVCLQARARDDPHERRAAVEKMPTAI